MATIKVKRAGVKAAVKKSAPEDASVGVGIEMPGEQPETAAARTPSYEEEIPAYDATEGQEPQLGDNARLFTESNHSSDEYQIPKSTSNHEWTTVPMKPKRAHSLDSAEASRVKNKNKFDVLPTEAATYGETADEVADEQPGPSGSKGKQIDPLEWGNVDLSDRELDIDAQAAAIRAYKEILKAKNKKSKKHLKNKHSEKSDKEIDFKMPKVSRHQSVPAAGHASLPVNRRAGSE